VSVRQAIDNDGAAIAAESVHVITVAPSRILRITDQISRIVVDISVDPRLVKNAIASTELIERSESRSMTCRAAPRRAADARCVHCDAPAGAVRSYHCCNRSWLW
jgi:hypothetical protein